MPINYSQEELEMKRYNELLEIADLNNPYDRLVTDPLKIFSNLFTKIGMEGANLNIVIASVIFTRSEELNYIHQ